MDLRPLGGTGISVSPLGLGTVKLGRTQGVKYPRPFQIPDDAGAARLLETAAAQGINLLDTAPAYGNSEERLGTLLSGQRDRWVLVTKVGEEFVHGASEFDFSAGAVRASVERSLLRLRTDRIDILLVHSDGVIESDLTAGGLLEELRGLKRRGLVRAIGASTKTPAGAMNAVSCCDVVMVTLNASQRDDEPAIQEAHRRNVGVLVKKALTSGQFEHAGAPGSISSVEAALGFVLETPGVSSAVIGTIDPAHLEADCGAARAVLRRGGQSSATLVG